MCYWFHSEYLTSVCKFEIYITLTQAVAAGLFFVGGWVFNTYKHFDEIAEANFTLIPASIIIAVGVLMFIVGIVGCIAGFKENKCLLAVVSEQ